MLSFRCLMGISFMERRDRKSKVFSSFLPYVNMRQFWKVNNSLLKVQVDVPDMKVE